MARFENETFENKTVVIDGNSYQNCTFNSCTIEFRGVELPSLGGCHFAGCRWSFDGPAANTIRFLTALYGNGDAMLQSVVQQTLDNIKLNALPGLDVVEQRPRK